MSTSQPPNLIDVIWTDEERWELYRILDLRNKLGNGQAYEEIRRVMRRGSRIVNIKLTVNDYLICVAHRYLREDGVLKEPDPKYFQIDDLRIGQ